ncbi:MAG: DNA polymerase I, partial [Anaerolineae bacterium]
KAHRAVMPDELRYQLERIHQLLEAFHIPIITLEGYEADDVLGTLSAQAEKQGIPTLIVTGDTDAFQLIDPLIRVMTSGRRFSDVVIYDEKTVLQRYGLRPPQLIDFKALIGDKSDNIPGVPGVGEKTATQLLQKYGTLENIYQHLDEITNARLRQALEEHREQAFLSKELARILRDAPITLKLDACRFAGYDRERVLELFRELEFRSLVSRLPALEQAAPAGPTQLSIFPAEAAPTAHPSAPSKPALGMYTVIRSEQELAELAQRLGKAPAVAFDTETTGLRPMEAALVGISLSDKAGEGYYIPVGHAHGPQLPMETVRRLLQPVLANPEIPMVAHNAIYDLIILRRHGLEVRGPLFDTMIAEWLIDPASRNLGLKNLVWQRLGMEMTPITDLIGSGRNQDSMANVAIEQAGPYAAADADMLLRLKPLQEAELKEKNLWRLFAEVEMPLVAVLADMEMAGIKLDVHALEELDRELATRMGELEEEIYQMVGYRFNLQSSQQLSDALFVHLGLPAQGLKKTSAGKYSTSADVLEKLRDAHPVVDKILEHRQIAKIKSTYIETLPALVNPQTGRVHTSFNQTGTVTGRLSSSDPNLQNIPIRTPIGRRVREAFVAEDGWLLLSADYSQVELRILAHMTDDPQLVAAFQRGEDIHTFTASVIFRVPKEEVTPEMRRIAKTTNFAIIYGVTAYGLAQQTGMSNEDAAAFIRAYFQQYPRVKEYVERCKEEAAKKGYVETLFGRRRYFPELQSGQKIPAGLRAAAERMAINMPVQGTAADIIKVAMIRLHHTLKERGMRSRLLLQVHDELVLEVPAEERAQAAALVKDIMENAYPLKVPVKVDCQAGPNWGQMEPC